MTMFKISMCVLTFSFHQQLKKRKQPEARSYWVYSKKNLRLLTEEYYGGSAACKKRSYGNYSFVLHPMELKLGDKRDIANPNNRMIIVFPFILTVFGGKVTSYN